MVFLVETEFKKQYYSRWNIASTFRTQNFLKKNCPLLELLS
ncbi:hypothetical protein MARINOS108_20627 [Marinoscillum sp. 108]|nr:hypothetical protein MARINOS108_20627 [Marinoscillum sp. 108]